MELEPLAARVRQLQPGKDFEGWVSLTFCILNAVWSIGANYRAVVDPLVRRVALDNGVVNPVQDRRVLVHDPLTLVKFAARYPDQATLITVTNRQRTSTRGGITKAAAVLDHVRIFRDHAIDTLQDAQQLLDDPSRRSAVDADLTTIRGEGLYGIRRKYLWMLIGDEQLIKPDRRVIRWLRNIDPRIRTPRDAEAAVLAVAKHLGDQYTPRQIDHAIWKAGWEPPRAERVGNRDCVPTR